MHQFLQLTVWCFLSKTICYFQFSILALSISKTYHSPIISQISIKTLFFKAHKIAEKANTSHHTVLGAALVMAPGQAAHIR